MRGYESNRAGNVGRGDLCRVDDDPSAPAKRTVKFSPNGKSYLDCHVKDNLMYYLRLEFVLVRNIINECQKIFYSAFRGYCFMCTDLGNN